MVADSQIALEEETRERLFRRKRGPNDTYEKVINRLIEGAGKGFEYTAYDGEMRYVSLDELDRESNGAYKDGMLEYVLKTLNESEELNGPLCWQTELWEGCTVEELIGALIQADNLRFSELGYDKVIED